MKFKGVANQLVRITKIKKHLVRKIPKSIRFDKDGIYETESPYLIKRLSAKFEEVVENKEIKDMGYQELQVLYAEKTGNSAVGVKKSVILEELEG